MDGNTRLCDVRIIDKDHFNHVISITSTSTALSLTSLTWPMSLLLTRGLLSKCTTHRSLHMLISTQILQPKIFPNPIMNEGLKVRFRLISRSMLHVMPTGTLVVVP